MDYKIEPNRIIYEDKIFLIYDKPQNLPTQNSQKNSSNLYDLLIAYQKTKRSPYLALHHRLDAATSGLVLFCKNKNYNKYVSDLFKNHLIKKNYLCISNITKEKPELQNWTNTQRLIPFKFKHFKKSKISKNGQESITQFDILSFNDKFALIKASPKTGRLHQIRVHLAFDNLPILGDFHYNKNKAHSSLMLHASELEFIHPHSKEVLKIKSELPTRFIEFLNIHNLEYKD